jgi:hypothetical protein
MTRKKLYIAIGTGFLLILLIFIVLSWRLSSDVESIKLSDSPISVQVGTRVTLKTGQTVMCYNLKPLELLSPEWVAYTLPRGSKLDIWHEDGKNPKDIQIKFSPNGTPLDFKIGKKRKIISNSKIWLRPKMYEEDGITLTEKNYQVIDIAYHY